MIGPLVIGAAKPENDQRRQIFKEKVHLAMDNYFSGDDI